MTLVQGIFDDVHACKMLACHNQHIEKNVFNPEDIAPKCPNTSASTLATIQQLCRATNQIHNTAESGHPIRQP